MAVIYGNGTRFVTRYQTSDGNIYDYDGMHRHDSDYPITRRAECVKRAESNAKYWFSGEITTSK